MSRQTRVSFCGVIEGSVTKRAGESDADAILRANVSLQRVLDRYARLYARDGERGTGGPVVGLEPA